MLVVRIEVWKNGNPRRAEEIHRALISNVTPGGSKPDSEIADYVAQFYDKGATPVHPQGVAGLLERSSVKRFKRLKYNAWHLLAQALASAGFNK